MTGDWGTELLEAGHEDVGTDRNEGDGLKDWDEDRLDCVSGCSLPNAICRSARPNY